MAYEKFIKKDGKTYGPYIYHSKRVDGKVVSEYHGQSKKDYKIFFLLGFGALLLGIFIYFFAFGEKSITGNSVLDLNANYQSDKPLEGNLKLALQEGELIPASSKLVLENNGEIYEFNLKDLISEGTVQGDFYVEGASVSGFGEGFGAVGEKETFPEVYFTLSILSQEDASSGDSGSSVSQETAVETENAKETETLETAEEIIEEPSQETSQEVSEEVVEEPAVEPESESFGIFEVVSGFFLGLTPTGFAVVESESEIQGKVSSGQEFRYILQEGQRAELKPRSVKTDSKQLNDDDVTLSVKNGELIVTTTYSEKESGFGQEYLEDTEKEFLIDVSQLNLNLEQGDLKLSIVDEGQELIFLTTLIEQEGTINAEAEAETPTNDSNAEILINESNNSTILPVIKETELTPQEKMILEKEFGNFSIVTKKAVMKNGFITVRYEFGEYWVENSYDGGLSNQTLSLFMESDRIKWLKDVAKKLSQTKDAEKSLDDLLENYSVS